MKAHDNLTFNVIGATMESPSQNPLACLYKPRVCGNKAELLRRNPCPVWLSLSARGWVGGQQAHLSSGLLGFAEGSSTASLFLRSAPRTTLCDPMDYSPPGSSVQGIYQARTLEWVVISYFRESSWPRDGTCISCIGRQILYHWASWEAFCGLHDV